MPFHDGQMPSPEEQRRLRELIGFDPPPPIDLGPSFDDQLATLRAEHEKAEAKHRDRSELLDLLAENPEAKAIRRGMEKP